MRFSPARLRDAREKAQMSQAEVYAMMMQIDPSNAVTQGTISNHESGNGEPDANALALYAKVYRKKLDDFFLEK